MKVTANIATYPPRAESLKKMLKSIEGQFDEVRVFLNGYSEDFMNEFSKENNVIGIIHTKGIDHADNGKFHGLDYTNEPRYYFTLDDDLIYPPDYVEKTIAQIKEYGCIISHHGRILNGLGLDYYHAHQFFQCTGNVNESVMLDVCGTGVTAFDTRYFHPKGLTDSENKRMSDLIFSLEAAKQGKTIGILPHKAGWIKAIHNKETIFDTEVNKGIPVQNKIADEIWKLRYPQA